MRHRGATDPASLVFETVAELPARPGLVYEEGWQSWSPSSMYRLGASAVRPTTEDLRVLNYRDTAVPAGAYQGEGLLAIASDDEQRCLIVAARDAHGRVPSIRAERRGDRILVSADGPVDVRWDGRPGRPDGALARWADDFAAVMAVPPMRRPPTVWCSWYHYYSEVAETDIDENLAAITRLELPIDVVQIDEGYEARIGDWTSPSGRFLDLATLADRIHDAGRRPGIWLAPFMVGRTSEIATRHPEWLVRDGRGPVWIGHVFDDDLLALDLTHPEVRDHLADTCRGFRRLGFEYFKLDFLYAGLVAGHRIGDATPTGAYRSGLELIREAIGDAYLVGCGAPMLASVGLVDAMRVSPDTAPYAEPKGGDRSEPSSRNAMITGRARAFQHGRFWVNDADCLIVRPEVEERETWAAHVERFSGLRASSDRIGDLDDWGLATTRRVLLRSSIEPFVLA